MLIWKEVARPGTTWYIDAKSGKPAKLQMTPRAIKYWHDQGRAMLASGLSIPVPLEHQTHLEPLTPAQKAAADLKDNTGFVKRYALRPGDHLWAQLDIGDPEIYQKLPKTIRYTSPWINSFTDGNGKKWEGVITHLALTSRPRITAQRAFGDVDQALESAQDDFAFDGGDVKSLPEEGLGMSLAGLLQRSQGGKLVPYYPMAFSLYSGVRLAMDYDETGGSSKSPSKDKKDEPPAKKKSEPGGVADGASKGDAPAAKPPDTPAGGTAPGDDLLSFPEEEEMTLSDVIVEMVKALWGIELPEDTAPENLEQRLLKALLEHLKTNGNAPPGGEPDMTNNPPPPGTQGAGTAPPVPVQEAPPMFMSLEEVQKIADPTQKRLAEQLFKEQTRRLAQEKRTLEQATAQRQQRVERLAKSLSPASRDRLLAQTTGARLSIDEDGSVHDPMAFVLDMLEANARELPTLLTTQAAFAQELPHPKDMTAGMTPERAKNVADEQCRNTGVPVPKAS